MKEKVIEILKKAGGEMRLIELAREIEKQGVEGSVLDILLKELWINDIIRFEYKDGVYVKLIKEA